MNRRDVPRIGRESYAREMAVAFMGRGDDVPAGIPSDDRMAYYLTLARISMRWLSPLVEVRCADRGHSVIRVYGTRWGDLADCNLKMTPGVRQGAGIEAGHSSTSLRCLLHVPSEWWTAGDDPWLVGACRCRVNGAAVTELQNWVEQARKTGEIMTITR